MPSLSMFFGIIIRMFPEKGERHNLPHIHALYAEYAASYDFDGNMLEGSFPFRQEKFVLAWIEIHREELEANWKLLECGEACFKIEPLR